MRIESAVTSISWIPPEAITGMPSLPFQLGIGHYDEVPPETLEGGDLERLRDADRFREANDLRAWIEVDGGKIIGHGYEGGGLVGSTTFRLGPKDVVVPGVAFEVLRAEPEVGSDSVRFVQTVGGRAGFPAPRRVAGKPFFRVNSATAWTTLALTIRTDGTSKHELVGASAFPRHWVYDREGKLVQKSGTIDFKSWYREAHGERTPWGDEDSQPVVAQVESSLERGLSAWLMTTVELDRLTLKAGDTLVEQGERGDDLYLLLDGVLSVEVDGEEVVEFGPGTIVGERAVLESGERTATLRAVTRCRTAVVPAELLDRASLEQIASGRRGPQPADAS